MTTEKRLKFSMFLPCKLTDAEVLQRSKELADVVKQIEALEVERAAEAKKMRDKIDERSSHRSALATVVRSRTEEREVECEEHFDYQNGVVETVRLDTGEVEHSRKITPEERQGQLFAMEGGKIA